MPKTKGKNLDIKNIDINLGKINANDSIVSGKNSPRFVPPIDNKSLPPFGLKTTNAKIKNLELDLAKINEDKKEFLQNSNTKAEKVET